MDNISGHTPYCLSSTKTLWASVTLFQSTFLIIMHDIYVFTSCIQIYIHHLWVHNQPTWQPDPSWLDSSTVKALHQNRRGVVEIPIHAWIFQAILSAPLLALKCGSIIRLPSIMCFPHKFTLWQNYRIIQGHSFPYQWITNTCHNCFFVLFNKRFWPICMY